MDNEAILVLSDNYPYFDDLENAAKIRKYAKNRNVAELPEAIQYIIRNKQHQASAYEKAATEHIASAIIEAKTYVAGEIVSIRASSVKDKIEAALSALVESVYTKLGYIRHNFYNDSELLQILSNQNMQMTVGGGVDVYNPEAVKEIEQFLRMQEMRMLPTSMGDIQRRFSAIPYGWREIDIAAAVCSLISIQRVSISYSGNMIQSTDRHIPDYLRRKTEIDKTNVTRRIAISDELMKKSREFLKDYFNTMDVPSDEDRLISYVLDSFTAERDRLQSLLDTAYAVGSYPDKAVVENGIKLCNDLLSQKKDNTALLNKMVSSEDDFLDLSEDKGYVLAFFKNQKTIYDGAETLLSALATETEYLRAEGEATGALARIRSILAMQKPYRNIAELPTLIQTVKTVYSQLFDLKKQDVYSEIRAAMGEIHQTAGLDQKEIAAKADEALVAKRKAAYEAATLTQLDAMKIQISGIRQQYIKALMVPSDPAEKFATVSRSSLGYSIKLKNEADIDKYVADIKDKLTEMLEGNDVLHII